MGMRTTGLQLLRSKEAVFLRSGIIVADFKQDGMWACELKILVKTPVSWFAPELFYKHSIRTSSLPWVYRPQHMSDIMFLQREHGKRWREEREGIQQHGH